MRIFGLIFLSFAIFAVTLAATGSTPKKDARNTEKVSSEERKQDLGANSISSPKAKKGFKSSSAENPSKKTPKKENDNDNLEIEKELTDLIKDDSKVAATPLDKLTMNIDPTELGLKIKKIADPKRKKELIAKLKKAWNQNRKTLPGKFYQAVYTSLSLPIYDVKERRV